MDTIKNSLFILLLLVAGFANGQEYSFKYQRPLSGINNTWHRIDIPAVMYSKLNEDFSDVRILGIQQNGDTIEAPYILKEYKDRYEQNHINFNLINKVTTANGYYYTFALNKEETINTIELNFGKSNFDWFVTLEGSQNQQDWFIILDKSRIVAIANEHTTYKYTTLSFGNASYKYLRLKVPSAKNPVFETAAIIEKGIIKGSHNSPEIQSFKVSEVGKEHESEILLTLDQITPLAHLKVIVKDSIDYYRPIKIEYATDSIKNKDHWQYLFTTLYRGTLSSLDKNGFYFTNQLVKSLRIKIDDFDNEPLTYSRVELYGYNNGLIGRFTKSANYYLVYGNSNAYVPNYDITRFESNIPLQVKPLAIGEEEIIAEKIIEKNDPLFKDDIWLWAIMIFVIFILGWFSFKMLKND